MISNINTPTKSRDFQVVLYIKVILIVKEIVMKLLSQDLHQIYNVTSILRFNDVKPLFKKMSLLCWQSSTVTGPLKSINDPMFLKLCDPVIFRTFFCIMRMTVKCDFL